MLRLVLTLCVALASLAPAHASRSESTWQRGFEPTQGILARLAEGLPLDGWKTTMQRSSRPQLVLTEGTEILLNGRACQYRDVPVNAVIVQVEVAADGRTVRRISFRTAR